MGRVTAWSAIRALAAVLILGAVFGLAWPGSRVQSADDQPTVTTDKGVVVGSLQGNVAVFLGIPYAAPTGGDNRFRPPQPREPWSTPFDATRLATPCAQSAGIVPGGSTNEDCLVLNVSAPRGLSGQRPVMVFLHGGGNVVDTSNNWLGTQIVAQSGVVVVSLNYRLGVFGFLALPGLDAESPNHISGNYGLLDQQFALGWIQRNIAAFGGDPNNVTLFGQSAGGWDILNQLVSPAAVGLFQKAILESPAIGTPRLVASPTVASSLEQAESAALTAIDNANGAASLSCPTDLSDAALVSCLRVAPASALTSLSSLVPFIAPVDGVVVPVAPLQAFRSGQFNRVPVMLGSNHDEGTASVAAGVNAQGHAMTEDEYESRLAALFGDNAAAVAALYPASRYGGSPGQARAASYGDEGIICGTERMRAALSPFVPVFGYEFSQPNPVHVSPVPQAPGIEPGDAHSTELAYVFGDDATGAPLPSGPDRDLSTQVIAYWTSFAASGDPNAAASSDTPVARTTWPPYQGANPQLLSIARPPDVIAASDFVADHNCSFWDSLQSSPNPG